MPSAISYVSKIPPDFETRTLARLLPPSEQLLTMTHAELVTLHKRAAELKRLIKAEPVRFYQPNPGGQWDFMTLDDPSIRVLLFIAGNKTGKTTAGAVKVAEAMTGRILWGHDWRTARDFKVPAYGCVFAEDFDSHKEVSLPAYLSWCPKKAIKDIKRNPAGNVVHIEHTNGSFLFFRTYDQGSDKAEGKDWDFVWCDEPPPRTIYTAVLRGLVTLNGLFIITATLLKETWLFDEAEDHEFIKMFASTIYDNPWLSDSAREDFVASLSDDERAVRVSGKPVSLTGLIYKEFTDAPPFIIPDQEFNPAWPIVMCVDPHERKPLYIMWLVITPQNTLIFFDWDCPTGHALDEIKAQIDAREASHHMPSCLVIMDPNRGRAKQIDGKSWEEVFNNWGWSTSLGMDDIRLGHTMVHTYLMTKTPDGGRAPRVRFTERCRGKGGPVYAMLRYAWDDWAVGRMRDPRKEVKEKPKETYKDFPDLVRYACVAELDFDTLKYGPKVIDRLDLSRSYRFGIRAGL